MIILVLGNTNSGKTYYTTLLSKALPKYVVIRIDDYRRKYGDGTTEGEKQAWERLFQDVENNEDCIVEFTGRGFHSLGLRDIIREREHIVVVIDTPCEECISNIREGKFDGIPFPYEIGEEEMIRNFDADFKRGYLKLYWGEYLLVSSGDICPVLARLGMFTA
ncbi:MAG: ATP-binding protein [archaeon]|nr:ATP-binding protein [archaeon]